ncbi:MAG: NAD(P)H-hydrate dehydratase [Candidatus Rifleibacteriota bacterium]
MRLLTSAEMRAADLHAIEKVGIPSLVLMENAGIKTIFTLERILGGLRNRRFCVICGKGNNGGDGLVIARHLANNNLPVYVFLLADPDQLSSDARTNLDILARMNLDFAIIKDDDDINRLRIAMEFSDCIIDCIFGTGFSGEIEGKTAAIIAAMNDSRATKVSVDLPSGLCATTGKVAKAAFYAEYTITLGAPKIGLFILPGKNAAGEVWVADIGIPAVSFESVAPRYFLVTESLAQTLVPERDPQMHKGDAGKVMILAGSDQYQGAAVIASYGAHRSGTGIVHLGLPESLRGNFSCQVLPETIIDWFPSCNGGFKLDQTTVASLNGHFRSLLAGPGWGRCESRKASLDNLLKYWQGNIILDADALNLIEQPEILKSTAMIPVITPHPGEMARLSGCTVEEIAGRSIEIASDFAVKNRTIVVLKSAVTLIADHTGRVFVSSRPNSGLARGGSGDLLSGLIAGLTATGISPLNAAVAGVHLLAEAAEIAVAELGADALTISEIASFMPRAFRKLRGESNTATS